MQKLNLYCPKYTLLNVMEEAGLPLEWAVIGGEIYYKGDDFDDYLDLIDYSYKSVEPVCFGTAVFSDLSIHKVQ